MKLRFENLATLLLISVIGLGGCSGCGHKTADQAPIDTPVEVENTQTNGKTKDPLLGDAGKIPLPPSHPKIVEPKTPDDYEGDPYLYISNIEYEMNTDSHGGNVSYPLLPSQIQQKLDDMQVWSEEGSFMTTEGPITTDVYRRMRFDIIAEEFSDLDMAKYLILDGGYDHKYAAEYAVKALDKNPNDYQTLYVWTQAQTDPVKSEQGYRRLVEISPNSAHVLLMLGRNLTSWEKPETNIKEGITYLKRSAALAPDLYKGLAFRSLGHAYIKLKDSDTAIAFYKRAQTIYESGDTQYMIERIEKGKLP